MSPFPPVTPREPDDLAVVERHDWSAFCALEVVEDHWSRPEWPSGRSSYHWMLPLDDQQELQGRATADQRELASTTFDPSPPESLHLTIGRIGFTDEVNADLARAIAADVRGEVAEMSVFGLWVGALTGSRGAVRYSVAPWSPLIQLHQVLSRATRRAIGDDEAMPTEAFRPHIGIAYSNSEQAAGDVAAKIQGIRPRPPVEMRITSVSVVRLERGGDSYGYTRLHTLPLGLLGSERSGAGFVSGGGRRTRPR